MALLAFAGLAGEAAAQDPAKDAAAPWYIGVGLGRSYSKIPSDTVNQFAQGVATATGGVLVDSDDGRKASTEGKLFLGYTFDPYIAIELGYATLGHADAQPSVVTGGGLVSAELKYKMTAPYLDVIGSVPLNDAWSLFARAGVTYARVAVDGGPSETKIREKFGAGIGYNFTPVVGIRAEWENYRMPDPLGDGNFRVNAAVISALYRF